MVATNPLPDWLLTAWEQALAARASDLHLSGGQPWRWRSGGRLQTLHALPACPRLSWAEMQQLLGSPQGCLEVPTLGRARWQLGRHADGWLLSLRLLGSSPPAPADVQLTAAQLRWMDAPAGLLLVTGATGAGKSSTLAALVQHWRQQHQGHVLTLEDPVEYRYPPEPGLVTQRQIGRDCDSFAQGLHDGLRQDPDLILIGELRDLASARLALTAAETGHLVLATLHTRSAVAAIDRLLGLFPGNEIGQARQQLADSLVAVIAQTLETVGHQRLACREVLVATPAVRHLIREQRLNQLPSLMQTGQAEGMVTRAAAMTALTGSPESPNRPPAAGDWYRSPPRK